MLLERYSKCKIENLLEKEKQIKSRGKQNGKKPRKIKVERETRGKQEKNLRHEYKEERPQRGEMV